MRSSAGRAASYVKRPYPCPKPVGEFAVQLPPDLPGLAIAYELAIEEGVLRSSARRRTRSSFGSCAACRRARTCWSSSGSFALGCGPQDRQPTAATVRALPLADPDSREFGSVISPSRGTVASPPLITPR